MSFLYANKEANEFFGAADIGRHQRLLEEEEMLSTAGVNAALAQVMNEAFLDEVRVAEKQDDKWTERGKELAMLRVLYFPCD